MGDVRTIVLCVWRIGTVDHAGGFMWVPFPHGILAALWRWIFFEGFLFRNGGAHFRATSTRCLVRAADIGGREAGWRLFGLLGCASRGLSQRRISEDQAEPDCY